MRVEVPQMKNASAESQSDEKTRERKQVAEKVAGVLSPQEVAEQFAAASDRLSLKTALAGPDDLPLVFTARKRKAKLSAEEYDGYKQETREDLDDFCLRVQRLKAKILSVYLAGSGADVMAHLAGKDKKEILLGKTHEVIADLRYQKELNGSDRENLVRSINLLLPTEWRIRMLPSLASVDANLFYEISSGIVYGKKSNINGQEQKILENILDQISELEQELYVLEKEPELFSKYKGMFVSEERRQRAWEQYRALLKQIAGYNELGSWFSPTYGTSGKGQRGKEQVSIRLQTDYQRFKMPEISAVERGLKKEYFPSDDAISFIFNSGLAALEAILLRLDREIIDRREERESGQRNYPEPKIFKTTDIYFEADDSIKSHFPKDVPVTEFAPEKIEELIAAIKREFPLAVFLNPMSNMYDMKVTEIGKILEAFTQNNTKDWRLEAAKELGDPYTCGKVYLVIDNSTLGRLAKWRKFDFHRLSPYVCVIAFESLVKYAEDGQDLVQAGLLTTFYSDEGDVLSDIRRRRGFMPPENTVRKLEMAALASDLNDKKMDRHSRNAELLVSEMEANIAKGQHFISEVIYPRAARYERAEVALCEADRFGALVNLGIDFNFLRSYQEFQHELEDITGRKQKFFRKPITEVHFSEKTDELAEAYVRLVVLLAKGVGLEINQGTSYGFNVTRLAVYDRFLPKEVEKDFHFRRMHYLRLSLGTENIKDAKLIAEIFRRVDEIFVEARENQRLFQLAKLLTDRVNSEIKFGRTTLARPIKR